jgi:NitT/TauT family transport system substrate-binding protein
MSRPGSGWSRRQFVGELTLASATGFLALRPGVARAEEPPETTKIKLVQIPGICVAPQYVAKELLGSEGFTDVQYVSVPDGAGTYRVLASGEADMSMAFAAPFIIQVDAGDPIVMLAGVHAGCFELFGTERIRSIRDLKSKTVAVPGLGSAPHVFIASMAAHVGLDPRRDIRFVSHPAAKAIQLLADAQIDAYLGFPPDPQELRARKVGHVIVNSAADRPWSQYFCCIATGNREFVRKHPIATKRALRAILKSTDICALEPERAARTLVGANFTQSYDFALQTMKEVPYGRWRQYDPEDTVRFYALRLHEAGMIKSSPQKIIAQGTDWRSFNELKKELKG